MKFGVKQYRKPMLALAIPIIIQNLIDSTISSTDVIMLNFVGQDAISAVSLAANFSSIIFMVYYGLGTGITMLGAQYYGKGDIKAIRVVHGIALRLSLMVSTLMALCAFFLPRQMMYIFTKDETLITLGASYLRYMGIAYLCWGVIEIFLSTMRCVGRVKTSMFLNLMAFGINIVLNATFIFGLFGAPKLGVAGVALGTAISRVAELIGCIIVSLYSKDIHIDLKMMFVKNKVLFADFRRMAMPALINDIIWGLAFSMYAVILGHLGSDAVAANSLVSVVRNFGSIMCFAMASGGTIYLGQVMGEGRIDEASDVAKELMFLTIASAAIGSLIIAVSSPFVLMFADLTDTAMGYLKYMLMINVYYIFGGAVNTTLIAGVFRAGGDSKYGMKVDVIDMWCYAVPLGFISAFVLKLPVMWVYFLLCTDEFVKWPWVLRHYKSGKWIKNITREDWDK
ncbi:MAG: MATE family efflux transporter [Lachnospiraceae bacterium]|nr:MATE family efflux transporter [Lachnospiraceae bacterium]